MRIIDDKYLNQYKEAIGVQIKNWWHAYHFSDERINLGYNTKISAVYSANIEGNTIDVNSFMNSMLAGRTFKPKKEIKEIEDLIHAYEFAQSNKLTEANLLKAHKKLATTLLVKDKRGKYRTDRMGVFDNYGLVYLAIEPDYVKQKMNTFFEDIAYLIEKEIEINQIFYHASLIHLIFVHLHPFWDGNGRSARLLEKWFLAEKMNGRSWKLQSEKYYKDNLEEYYTNINLGVNYYELNYDRCLNFLKMLPMSLRI